MKKLFLFLFVLTFLSCVPVPKAGKESTDVLFKRGKDLYDNGDYASALKSFREIAEKNPNFSEIFLYIGNCYLQVGFYERAEEAYLKQLSITPKNEKVFINLGITYKGMKDYKKALEMYLKALEINPNNPDTYFNLGILCYENLDLKEQAIFYFKKCIKLEPNSDRAIELKKFIEEIEKKK
ncbi:MAG: tetratricopeptide repeat protein [Candidatus Aminicenantia bacterium]